MMSKRTVQIIVLLMVLLLALPVLISPAFGDELNSGTALFESHCAGCHVNGGNIIRRGKTLKQKALTKNGYDSIEAIAQLVREGKGNMSAYGEILTDAEIRVVSQFVLDQAEAGWPR